jgi:hypothetical protein
MAEQIDSSRRAKDNRWMPATFSSRLADLTLPDPDGKPWRLGSFWAERPAVVVFLRHYG